MAENNWAIVIGINAYEFLHKDYHLEHAVNDAVKVQQFLCKQANFDPENVLLCCDRAPGVFPQQRPTRNGLRHLLKNEIQGAKGANNFWFFYAGHGIVHDHQDFLLPCDGNPSDLRDTAIPISFVTDCLRDCGADNVVLVMDMCRNRTPGRDEGSRDIGEVMGEQTQQIARERGIVTLFSCSRGQRSYEIDDLEQGAFTHVLLEGLRPSITPRALEHYLTKQLPALNRQYGKPIQVPMVIPEPGWKYDLPLLLSCATPADIQQLAAKARDAELEEQDYEKAKALWWQVIEADRSTPSDRAKARKAIDRINYSIQQKTEADEQRRAEEARKKAAERLRELERQQKLEQQRQEQIRREAAAKQRQAEEQERQRREAEQLKRQQTEAERRRQEELERQRVLEQQRRELPSEKGINYTKLRDLLQANQWQDADQETYLRMLEVVGGKDGVWIPVEEWQNFPCTDLQTIDRLWVKYSNGHFGFSVQKKIWQECGSPKSGGRDWDSFCIRVRWQSSDALFLPYSTLKFDIKKSLKGELPFLCSKWDFTSPLGSNVKKEEARLGHNGGVNIFARVATCGL